MDKIYLVIVNYYNICDDIKEENSVVNICSTKEKAEELKNQYIRNCRCLSDRAEYHIDEVILDSSNDILWDCYNNSEIDFK